MPCRPSLRALWGTSIFAAVLAAGLVASRARAADPATPSDGELPPEVTADPSTSASSSSSPSNLAAPASSSTAPSSSASAVDSNESSPPPVIDEVPTDLGRLIFDDGRKSFTKPARGVLVWGVHGEIQLRGERDSALPLQAPVSDPSLTTLGARNWGTTWIRVGAQLSYSDKLRVVAQIDAIPRWIIGDLPQGVSADGDFARDASTTSFARLRYAYVDYTTPIGLLRVGQMGSHWGLGIIANDGDHARLFGDYRFGTIVERIAFATRPAGAASPFVLALAGDAVMTDDTSKWADGDRTYQLVGAAYYEKAETFFGLYGVRRFQKINHGNDGSINVWVLDATARGAIPVGETGNLFAYAAAEVATIFGKTDAIRTTPEFTESQLRTFGGAANLGIVNRGRSKGRTFGRVAMQLDAGYASGDGDPYDGTIRRFTFDPNYQVGLVMFPYVMHFMTARSSTNALDPSLVARPFPGSKFLGSHGGAFGAQYLNPTLVVRPTPDFDVKVGLLVAVATSDVVDPYRTTTEGSAHNFRGGAARSRDLGLELDYGFEWRIPLQLVTLQVGYQGGVLFPGHAFDDVNGEHMKPQTVLQGRFGGQF